MTPLQADNEAEVDAQIKGRLPSGPNWSRFSGAQLRLVSSQRYMAFPGSILRGEHGGVTSQSEMGTSSVLHPADRIVISEQNKD